MGKMIMSSESEIAAAAAHAKKVLGAANNPRIRELMANGLIFSAGGGVSVGAVTQVYAPIFAEALVDFALHNLDNDEDKDARAEAHRSARMFVDLGIKTGTVDKVLEANRENVAAMVDGFEKLLSAKKYAAEEGIGFEAAMDIATGKAVKADAEVVGDEE